MPPAGEPGPAAARGLAAQLGAAAGPVNHRECRTASDGDSDRRHRRLAVTPARGRVTVTRDSVAAG